MKRLVIKKRNEMCEDKCSQNDSHAIKFVETSANNLQLFHLILLPLPFKNNTFLKRFGVLTFFCNEELLLCRFRNSLKNLSMDIWEYTEGGDALKMKWIVWLNEKDLRGKKVWENTFKVLFWYYVTTV